MLAIPSIYHAQPSQKFVLHTKGNKNGNGDGTLYGLVPFNRDSQYCDEPELLLRFPEETSLFNSNTLWELGPSFTATAPGFLLRLIRRVLVQSVETIQELWLSPPITMTNLSTNEKRPLQNLRREFADI